MNTRRDFIGALSAVAIAPAAVTAARHADKSTIPPWLMQPAPLPASNDMMRLLRKLGCGCDDQRWSLKSFHTYVVNRNVIGDQQIVKAIVRNCDDVGKKYASSIDFDLYVAVAKLGRSFKEDAYTAKAFGLPTEEIQDVLIPIWCISEQGQCLLTRSQYFACPVIYKYTNRSADQDRTIEQTLQVVFTQSIWEAAKVTAKEIEDSFKTMLAESKFPTTPYSIFVE